ncbi:MAG: hypothetical protein JWO38_5146 [Gemmataceae bacterium]|nr:hypothetical protein [Gemmataceae bacterium]
MVDRPASTLLEKVTCPHCWHHFEPHNVLWIAAHPALRGDPRLGSDAHRRFLSSRFTPRGGALDESGTECTQLACPNCHLHVPRLCLELKPWFVSIFGAPASGKSYFLAAMTWALRRRLPAEFRVSFTDTDADANQLLAGYEQPLFYNPTPDDLLPLGELIEKTKEQGDLYDTAQFGSDVVQFPRPFLFTIRPQPDHPATDPDPASLSRILCLYDNAGESFLAGRDSSVRPVTRHLAESSLLLFLFDPTQHQPFRQRLAATRGEVATDIRAGQGVNRQDLILTEAASRVRRFAGLRDNEKHDQPLIVIVTKQDVWEPLVPELRAAEPVVAPSRGLTTPALNLDRLDDTSQAIRRLLLDLTPEVVTAAESFARTVVYVGASALGVAPVRHPQTGRWSVRPADLKPTGVEIPFLYGLSKQIPRLVPSGRRPRRPTE